MPKAKTSLAELLHEVRRIEESREVLTEKKVRKIYKRLTKDLNAFVGEMYTKYADKDGALTVAELQKHAQYASFLEEMEKHCNEYLPDVADEIEALVLQTRQRCYDGMVDAIAKSYDLSALGVRPEVMTAAMANNIGKLTLPPLLEKNRKEIIYEIKQTLNIGLMNGERYDTMTRKLVERLDISHGKAKRIVRTESHRNIEGGFMDCAERLGEGLSDSGYIYAATWRTMEDERVRPQRRRHTKSGWKTSFSKNGADHMKMEGQTVKVGELFNLGNGVKAKAPAHSGVAAHDCNCRCFLEYNLMTADEFAKATGQAVETVNKKYNKSVEDDKFDLLIDKVPDTDAEKAALWKPLQSVNVTPAESKYINAGYVGTPNSWTINKKLRKSPELSVDEIYKGNTQNAKTARALQSVIQKNTMPKNTMLTRNAGEDFVQDALGLSPRQLSVMLDHFDDADVQDTLKEFVGIKITENAFVSTSANPAMNIFNEKPVRLELKVKKGHNAYITENVKESEVILDRGTQYVVEGFDKTENRYGMPVLKIIAKVVSK